MTHDATPRTPAPGSADDTGARVAICFVVADSRHRIPRRPRWRWLYRSVRRALLRARVGWKQREPRDADYAVGLGNAIATLRKRSRDLPPILLLSPDDGPKPDGVDELLRVDTVGYRKVRGVAYEFGVSVFYKLEVFRLSGYDRVVYFDCDLLFVDDVSALWDMRRYRDHAMYAVRESADNGASYPPAFGTFNSGVLVLNAPMLHEEVHDDLLEIAAAGRSSDGGDQGVLHRFLTTAPNHRRAGELEPAFNLFVDDASLASGLLNRGAKILHFTGTDKPFARGRPPGSDRPTDRLYAAVIASEAPRPLAQGAAALLASSEPSP
jgi:hypothetical protein